MKSPIHEYQQKYQSMSKKVMFCLMALFAFTLSSYAQASSKKSTTTTTASGATVKTSTHVVDNKNKTMVQRKTQVKSGDGTANTQSKVVYKKDGTVDRRYKTSKTLKNDGTPDKRYKVNKTSTNATKKAKVKTTVKK
jgi:uncharacterized protein with beta-barrel porin domain